MVKELYGCIQVHIAAFMTQENDRSICYLFYSKKSAGSGQKGEWQVGIG